MNSREKLITAAVVTDASISSASGWWVARSVVC
jgi:hypothetical protein